MSTGPTTVPDAWDDEWEKQADQRQDDKPNPPSERKVSSRVTKAQRRAAHVEFNRQLWAEAESQQTFHYLEAKSSVPLRQDFKPGVTVLARRPQIVSRQTGAPDTVSTVASTSRPDFNGDEKNPSDSDDEANKRLILTPEERQAKALRDLEEKQRKYEEVRERLFGTPSTPGSGASSPGSTTPPSRQNQGGEGHGQGRTRGGVRDKDNREKRDLSNASGRSRQLYDPSFSAKSNAQNLLKDRRQPAGDREEGGQQMPGLPTRNPRGPDGSGRGGHGFSRRGK